MLLISLFCCSSNAIAEITAVDDKADSRKIFSNTSPKWLAAVGKLKVPSIKIIEGQRRNHREDCSATLISRPGKKSADTIVTAWHCLEFYTDLSKDITFTLLPSSENPISALVHRLADGGSMHADWAILRLQKPVAAERVLPLLIHPDRASIETLISMAGYSSDPGLGQGGALLTYDPSCAVTLHTPNSSNTNCRAFRGASGGAVVQLTSAGEPRLSGVISQGDGEELSTFIPVTGFRSALNQHLN
ncbi:MAG: serine protease [Halioglobus sp.]